MSEPLLSILIATYNHEKFIGALLDSVLMQCVDFEYEIIICDDCSQDKTREILTSYFNKHPDKINLIFNEKNKGVNINARKLFELSKGKYICTIDGDDRWIFNKKLQYQIDFLETNLDYSATFHDAEIISTTHEDENSNERAKTQTHREYKYFSQFNHYRSDFFAWDLLQRNIIPTASLIFRKPKDLSFFDLFDGIVLSLSWILELYLMKQSKFKYFNEVWSVYNDHPGGVSKRIEHNSFKKSNIDCLKFFLTDDYYSYMKKDVYAAISAEYKQILFNQNTKKEGKKFFNKNLKAFLFYSIKQTFSEVSYFYIDYHKKTD